MKANGIIHEHREQEPITYDILRDLCRDFFEAGIIIASSQFPAVSCDPASQTDFDVFWNQYDKKVGRTKCEKLWSKLSVGEKTECIAYVPLYVQAQPDKQYRKNPETFLRNKSWNDEIIFRNNDNKPTIEQQRIEKLADILNS